MTYKAYYYLKSNGRAPLEEYLSGIKDIRTLVAIESLINRLIDSKCQLTNDIVKPVIGKIYELRLMQKVNQCRIFYFIYENGKIILLDGYTKKSNKITKNILKRVQNYYYDYLNNNHERVYIRENS